MVLTLFSKAQCPFCWQVKLALDYFGLDYELQEWETPDKHLLLQYSPQGSSPILFVDEFPIWDSLPIIYYLEDTATKGKTLFPGNNIDHAKARLLHTYNNSIAGKSLREVIFEKRGKQKAAWDWDRIAAGEQGWRITLDWLEKNIESHENFLLSGFSIADVALLPRFGLAQHYGVGVDERHPKLFHWFGSWQDAGLYKNTSYFYN